MADVGMKVSHHLHAQGKPRHCSKQHYNPFSYFFQYGKMLIICFAVLISLTLSFAYIPLEIMRAGGDDPQFGSTSSTRFFTDLLITF